MKKATAKRVMSYFGHVIWASDDGYFSIANGDGTDTYFDDIHDAMNYIEKIEGIE